MNYGLKITPCTPFANLIGEGYELEAIVSKFYASHFFQGCVLAPLENRLTTFNHVEMTRFACTHKVSTLSQMQTNLYSTYTKTKCNDF